jgi:APA family basic amino acid/polyamine antiporter
MRRPAGVPRTAGLAAQLLDDRKVAEGLHRPDQRPVGVTKHTVTPAPTVSLIPEYPTSPVVSLGYEGMAASGAVAVDAVTSLLPAFGERLVSLMICISALGAVNGLIFAGARISFAVGSEHRAFKVLGRWNRRTGTPVRSLLLQAAVAVTLIIVLGSFVNTILYMAASVYSFYLATSMAVFVLRRKEPRAERPYKVAGYPWPTLVFCAVCAFLIYSAVAYRPLIAASSCVLLLAGYPVYRLTSRNLHPSE